MHHRHTHRPYARPCTWQRLLYGLAAPSVTDVLDTVNRRRIQFVNQRLYDIGRRRPPDRSNYMDSGGTRRRVHTQEDRAARAALEVARREVAAAGSGSAPALLLTVPNALRPRGASAAMRRFAPDACGGEAVAGGDEASAALGSGSRSSSSHTTAAAAAAAALGDDDAAAAPVDSSLSVAELAWYRLCRAVDSSLSVINEGVSSP